MPYAESLTALADPTRRRVFEALRHGPLSVGALAKGQPVSRPAVSQHLKILVDAGLVTAKAQGNQRLYAVKPEALADLRVWLDSFWDEALKDYHAEITGKFGN